MATSLQEQLQRLRAPQTSILVDSMKRASILFDQKDAATKSRKTIFEIGLTGLRQLVSINPVFLQFEHTLFDRNSIDLERAIEDAEVNRVLDKNIKKFFHHLAPYFMLEPAQMCLEWLIRRFNVHDYNKNDFIALILAYHETMIFVKCVQAIDLSNPQDPWRWLSAIQKPGVPLSKSAIFNRAASDKFFLEFVCQIVMDAVKELDNKARFLQAHINFYCLTVIGAMEHRTEITESFITSILPSVLMGLTTPVIDLTSAVFMIIAQLVSKTQLNSKLLNALVDKISSVTQPKMQDDILLLLVLIYQKQGSEINTFPKKTLVKFISNNWVPSGIAGLTTQSVAVSALCVPLMGSCLRKVQTKEEGWKLCKTFLENLLSSVHFVGEEAKQIIRATLDNYHRQEPRKPTEDEVIEINSDDDDLMVEDDIQKWYSSFLEDLERQYPAEFDSTIKETLQEQHNVSEARRLALKTVLAFRLKSTYSKDNTAIYENLYHHNAMHRVQAVKYLIRSLSTLNLSDGSQNLLKDSLVDRLNDDNPKVINEILKLPTKSLVEVIGVKTTVENLIDVINRSHIYKENWSKIASSAIKHITSPVIFNESDKNNIFIALFPFLMPTSEQDMVYIKEILRSEFAAECPFLKAIKPKIEKEKNYAEIFLKVREAIMSTEGLPSVKNILESVKNAGTSFLTKSSNYTCFIFTISACCTPGLDPEIGLEVLQYVENFEKNFEFIYLPKNKQWMSTIRKNKVPKEVYQILLTVLAKNLIIGTLEDFSTASQSSFTLFLKIYENLVENAFFSTKSEKVDNENSLGIVLKTVFPTPEQKLNFLSNFFVSKYAWNEEIKPELQIRSIKIFDLVLKGSDQTFTIDWTVFIKILFAFTSKLQVIRECSLRTLENLLEYPKMNENLAFLTRKILERSEEILIDQEQFPLVLFTIISPSRATKDETAKEKELVSECLAAFIKIATDSQVPDYLKVGVLEMLKHINSATILKKLYKSGLDVLQYVETSTVNSKEDFCLDDLKWKILSLIIARFEEDTIRIVGEVADVWNLIEKTLLLHKILVRNNGKLESLSCGIIETFTEDIYDKLPEKYKERFIRLVVEAVTFAQDPSLPLVGGKLFRRINLDATHGIAILEEMKDLCQPPPGKRRTSKAIAPDPEALNSPKWKCGITFLEFVQNKKKLSEYQNLISVLFELLKKCLEFEEQSTLEYVKQMALSCILHCCQKLNAEPSKTKSKLQDNIFKTDLVVQCIRATENPQTHHHALLLLSHLALMIPHQVLHNMMDIFTFMGSSLVRHDDAFSFQIISNIVESVVPTLVQAQADNTPEGRERAVVPILKVFADIALDVPEHRRLPLYIKLVSTLGASQFLWMFVCLLFESHVVHSEEDQISKVQKRLSRDKEEIPKRVEVALQLIKDFEPDIGLQTCTSLFDYLQKLPLEKPKDQDVMEVDIADTALFDVNGHSSKQLRHYKYVILQFISNFTSSTDFINSIALLSEEETKAMKPIYQNFIIKVLSYIPQVTAAVEKNANNNQSKFWQVLLHHCYDVLDSAICLLSADMLLIVVHGLLQHQLAAVRRKVIEILVGKLQYNPDFFANCNEDNLLKLLKPLTEIVNTILKEKFVENTLPPDIMVIQQISLIAIKLLSKILALKHVEEFKDILLKLSKILKKRDSISNIILATVILAITEISSNLKAHSIGHLAKFVPHIIDVLQEQSEAVLLTQAPDNVCLAIVTGVQKLFETLPLFLGPYIVDLIFSLCLLWAKILTFSEQEPRIAAIVGRLNSVWGKAAALIPLRVLMPNCEKVYKKLIEQWQFKGIKFLMRLLTEAFKHASAKDIQSLHGELTSMFLQVLDLRNELVAYEDQNEVTTTEEDILQAFVVHILKLSESYFRPLYHKVYEWAMKEVETQDRAITFFLLSSKIAVSLKSLFVLFASEFIKDAANLLDNCNKSKAQNICFPEFEERRILLIENILKTLHQIFLYDSKGFINTHRFDILMQPIVDQLENPLVVENDSLKELVTVCLSQLAVAANNDTLWKQLNYQILLKTRSNNPEHRIIAFMCCVEIARKLGENFSSLLPETIPFVAELLEDENEEVEKKCRKGVQELEKILGESLQNYF